MNKSPVFKIIEVDALFLMPQKITTYAYDVEAASAGETDESVLITPKIIYPDDYDMEDLSPSQFYSLAQRILNEES